MLVVKLFVFIVSFKLILSSDKTVILKSVQCEVSEQFVESNFSCAVKFFNGIPALSISLIFKKPLTDVNVTILNFIRLSNSLHFF